MLRCLEVTPSLTELIVIESYYSDHPAIGCGNEVLEALTYSALHSGRNVCPHLQLITIESAVSYSDQISAMLAMIQSRWWIDNCGTRPPGIARLRRMHLIFEKYWEAFDEFCVSVKRLQDEGLDISVDWEICHVDNPFILVKNGLQG
jgi:hypothetical protein